MQAQKNCMHTDIPKHDTDAGKQRAALRFCTSSFDSAESSSVAIIARVWGEKSSSSTSCFTFDILQHMTIANMMFAMTTGAQSKQLKHIMIAVMQGYRHRRHWQLRLRLALHGSLAGHQRTARPQFRGSPTHHLDPKAFGVELQHAQELPSTCCM